MYNMTINLCHCANEIGLCWRFFPSSVPRCSCPGYHHRSRDTCRWEQEDNPLRHWHDQMHLLRLLSRGMSRGCYCRGSWTVLARSETIRRSFQLVDHPLKLPKRSSGGRFPCRGSDKNHDSAQKKEMTTTWWCIQTSLLNPHDGFLII